MSPGRPKFVDQRLPIRPGLQPGEWWDGFVYRTLHANGLKAQGAYWLRKLEASVSSGLGDAVPAQHRVAIWPKQEVMPFGQLSVPAWALLRRGPKVLVCRQCLQERCVVRMEWRLALYRTCVRHGTPLARSCSACHGPISVWDVAARCCSRCGTPPWVAGDAEAAPGALVEFTRSLWGQERDGLVSVAQASSPSQQEIQQFACRILAARLIWDLSRGHWPTTDNPMLGLSGDARSAAYLEFRKLPLQMSIDGLVKLLTSLSEVFYKRAVLRFLQAIDAAERRRSTVLSTLPLHDWVQLLRERGATPVHKSGSLGAGGNASREHLSLNLAARQARTTHARIHELMEAGAITPAVSPSWDRTYYHVTREQVAEIERLKRDPARFAPLGLDADALPCFLRSGAVRGARRLVGAERLDTAYGEFIADLAACAQPLRDQRAGWICLASVTFWRTLSGRTLRSFVRELRAGEHPLYEGETGIGLGRFFVEAITLQEQRARASALARAASACSEDVPAGAVLPVQGALFDAHQA